MKKVYNTEQRKQLHDFLKENSSSQYTVEEIADAMNGEHAPGKSTIYRLIKEMVEDGTVKRYTRNNTRQFVYQLLDGEECNNHLHLKCVECGKLIHLQEKTSNEAQEIILEDSGFEIDKNRTMLFGKCNECRHH